MSDLHKIIDDVELFINSNVSEKLVSYERDIETHQESLTELTNRRKKVEQAIIKLREDVATQEIKKREMLDNVTLRETKKAMEILKEQCQQLSVQLKNMNYDEIAKKWEQLEDDKQSTLRRVSNSHLSYIAYTLTSTLYNRVSFSEECIIWQTRGAGKSDQTIHARTAKGRLPIRSS